MPVERHLKQVGSARASAGHAIGCKAPKKKHCRCLRNGKRSTKLSLLYCVNDRISNHFAVRWRQGELAIAHSTTRSLLVHFRQHSALLASHWQDGEIATARWPKSLMFGQLCQHCWLPENLGVAVRDRLVQFFVDPKHPPQHACFGSAASLCSQHRHDQDVRRAAWLTDGHSPSKG